MSAGLGRQREHYSESLTPVIPVKTGIQKRERSHRWKPLDSRLRGNDASGKPGGTHE